MHLNLQKSILLASSIAMIGCTHDTITPLSNAEAKNYQGTAQILVAVDGDGERKLRHIELSTAEESDGYEVYFKDKIGRGFISLNLPAPSTNVKVKEYSLTGMYGCSRGKAGYGKGYKTIAKVLPHESYFLGTVNTSMNTMYDEMPENLIAKAKAKYHYTAKGTDIPKKRLFRTNPQIVH